MSPCPQWYLTSVRVAVWRGRVTTTECVGRGGGTETSSVTVTIMDSRGSGVKKVMACYLMYRGRSKQHCLCRIDYIYGHLMILNYPSAVSRKEICMKANV